MDSSRASGWTSSSSLITRHWSHDGLGQRIDLPAALRQADLLFRIAHEQHERERLLQPP